MAKSRGYTRKQTGTPSRFGGAAGGAVRRVLNPWGNNVPKLGRTSGVRKGGGAVRRPKPDPQVWSMKYPANDPLQWPIVGGKHGSPSGMTQAKANFNNGAVNRAYKRAGYPEP
jgi:hypothetical protein